MPAKPYPTAPSLIGKLVFCPNCYPTLGMTGDRRHYGDFSRDFEYGNLIELYDMYGTKVLNVERAVFPYDGTPVVQGLLFQDGRPVKCAACYYGMLRYIEAYPGLEVRFLPGYPDGAIPAWLRKTVCQGVPE
jgi:hypothetical protein